MLYTAHSELYAHPVQEGHRFPMQKYALLPGILREREILHKSCFFEPEPIAWSDACLVHSPDYLEQLATLRLPESMVRRIGFKLDERLVLRERVIAAGSVMAVDFAMRHGAAMNIAGGTHHAGADFGEGYCMLNDLAIAAAKALQKYTLPQVLILDLDVHQGNGTASIFKQNSRVFTYSMHAQKAYPLRKIESDLDIPLPDGTEGGPYLEILDLQLRSLIKRIKPSLILYNAGVDVLASDKVGRLQLNLSDCRMRDRLVYTQCKHAGIPVVTAMGGAYSSDLNTILEAHTATFEEARNVLFG
jgi:acetoin utilization deacetylase AcuC-like enzyme